MGIKHKRVVTHGQKGEAVDWNDNHEIDGDVECAQHQHIEHVIENLIAFPPAPVMGQIIYRTDELQLYIWNGAAWLAYIGINELDFIHHDGTIDFTANQSLGGFQLTSVADPTLPQDAATMNYVDNAVTTLDWDTCWTDAVHSHENNAEGGQLDLFAVADATTKTRYLAISPSAVSPISETVQFTLNFAWLRLDGACAGACFCFPVLLPHGAIVTAAVLYGTAGGAWALYRCNNNSTASAIMAQAATNTEDVTISNATIDNQTYNYMVQASLNTTEVIHGIRITYTITADNQG